MRTADLCKFIVAREQVRLNKEAGLPRAKWTKDPILATYRFCNVHREDDRVTKVIAGMWRDYWRDEPDLWFAMVVARLFNLPSTLVLIGDSVLPFNPERMRRNLKEMRQYGPIFNGAYIVSTNGKSMDKVDYLIDCVLAPLWRDRKVLRPDPRGGGDTLAVYHGILMNYDGLGSFMAAQVVADLKYVEPLKNAPDWHTWAASGPGSRRGLNRVAEAGFPVNDPWKEADWLESLQFLQRHVNERLSAAGIQLHAQDLQNCLCEFDKYERVRLGEGRPKQLYKERT